MAKSEGRLFDKVSVCKILLCSVVLSVFMMGSAYGHSPVLWCYVQDGQVHVEAFFMGGTKIQNAKIYVVDKNGNKLLEGKTNEKGLFHFTPPVKDDMTILLRIDSGHSAEFTITKQDFLDAEKEQERATPK